MHLPRGGPHHHCCHLSELDCQAIEIGSALGLNVAPGPSARHLDSALESATVLHVVISETATVIPNPAASFADGGEGSASSFLLFLALPVVHEFHLAFGPFLGRHEFPPLSRSPARRRVW